MKLVKLIKPSVLAWTAALLVVALCLLAACVTVNPETSPVIDAELTDLFSLDPDRPDVAQSVAKIAIKHPVKIKDWTVRIQPQRSQQAGQAAGGQAGQGGQARPAGQERPAGEARPAGQEGQQRQPRGPFFEQTGTGTPPKEFKWNGKSSRPSGELVQSASEYAFTLVVNDVFDNTATFEGTLSTDVLVRREGDNLRMIVPSIVFPPNSADFRLLSDQDMRGNRRVLRLIGNALTKYPDYTVEIEGHSNPTTTPDTADRTNEETKELQPLSEARAKAVLDYLVENQSIEKARLTSGGMGGTKTVADYSDAEENWKNRRVEFILHK